MHQAPIYFENGFEQLASYISDNAKRKFFFVVDKHTHEFCLPLLLAELPSIMDLEIIECPVGEETKSIDVAHQVWRSLSDLGADRNCIIINCGGGVITDFGGFVASTFKRGVKFINVPTSLLAMVDASVGGKTGINLGNLKNQIGTFAQPEMVIISPEFLHTLPQKHMRSGFAEMLKHGLIQDASHWNALIHLEEISVNGITDHIARSVEIKSQVVEQDPMEQGLRKILNAGHTIGHALESYYMTTEHHLLHGEAVALGLWLEAHIAHQKAILSEEAFEQIRTGLNRFYSFATVPKVEQILPFLKHDKKNLGDKVQFVLLRDIGVCDPIPYEVTETELDLALKSYDVTLY